ncbi:thioredoxin [uncultured Desulfovibrio sp.]|uniref:thioredoxin n=1 Tax=uncultured Desulfovibrio sp. TaxID=167968 RepID=UPI00261B60B8|nr:thioredoxin [uncultured Desulfovibrio sp.]
MEFILVALLIAFLLFLYLETQRRAARQQNLIAAEKAGIADASRMTASIGVFTPDVQTTVIIGASEEYGAFYYRMLRQSKLINRSKINLANIVRVDLLINERPYAFDCESTQPTTSLRATELCSRVLSLFSSEELKTIQRAAIRIVFFSDSGSEKSLEITSLRSSDERHRFQRVQLLKNSIWWVAFLNMSSRQARHIRTRLEEEEEGDSEKS